MTARHDIWMGVSDDFLPVERPAMTDQPETLGDVGQRHRSYCNTQNPDATHTCCDCDMFQSTTTPPPSPAMTKTDSTNDSAAGERCPKCGAELRDGSSRSLSAFECETTIFHGVLEQSASCHIAELEYKVVEQRETIERLRGMLKDSIKYDDVDRIVRHGVESRAYWNDASIDAELARLSKEKQEGGRG